MLIEVASEASVSDGHRRLSAEELRDEVLRVAGSLRAKGLLPGSRVMVLGLKSVELVAALLAVPAAGGVVVAPYHGLSTEQLRHIYDDAQPSLTIILESAPAAAGANVRNGAPAYRYADLLVDGCSGVGSAEPSNDEPAMIIYTSGSTGEPKGVVLSHANLRLGADSVASFYGLSPSDRILCLLPFSFDAGLNQLLSGLSAGCDVHLRDFVLPQHAIEVCSEQRISILTGVPALWRRLADLDWPSRARGSMRRWATTGGNMPSELCDRISSHFPHSEPILMYGFTEAFRATYVPWERIHEKKTSVGIPIPHAALAVVGPKGQLCGVGEVGEIVQFGPLVSAGYWNRPGETTSKFASLSRRTRTELEGQGSPYSVPVEYLDQVAWSGDDGSVDEDGYVYFHARRTDLIKSQGFRVSPTEIEAACLTTGLVDDAVALGIEHYGEDEIIAVVARPASKGVTVQDLIEELKGSVPSYQMPSVVVLRDALPIGPNGKHDRAVLRQEILDGAVTI